MQCPVPVTAAVDGLAAAAGCQLVAACDIAVCTEKSTFSTPGYANSEKIFVIRIENVWAIRKILFVIQKNLIYNAKTILVICSYFQFLLYLQCFDFIFSNEILILVFRANFGIFCSTPGIPLVRNVSRKVASHMLFTGLPITAKEAYEAGLVSKVVPNGKLGIF